MSHEKLTENKREYNYKNPENKQEYDRRLSEIDDDVKKSLFRPFLDIMNMLDDEEQYDHIVDVVNQDIFDGKYKDARYEHGIVYGIGSVNSDAEKISGWDDLAVPEYRKPENQQKYDEKIKTMDPKVFKRINKVVGALGDMLDVESVDYMNACNKINQDIFDGRYDNATYMVLGDAGTDLENGSILRI